MGYTPKHAKPASARDAGLNSHHGSFGIIEAASGRHARTSGKARRDQDSEGPATRRSSPRA